MIGLRLRKHAAIAGGFGVSALFLWLALRQVDGESLNKAFIDMKLLPVVFCAGALSIGIFLRGIRWGVIAGFSKLERCNFLRATTFGVLANLIFSGRAGEFVRVLTLAKLCNSSLPAPLASALLDRMVDLLVLMSCAVILTLALPISILVGKWIAVILILVGLITLLIFVFERSSKFEMLLMSRFAKGWLEKWSLRPDVFIAELRREFKRLLGSWLSVELVVLTLLVLIADYAAIAALIFAFNLVLPAEAPLLLWVFFAAGSALPAAPGYVGIHQIAAVWALAFYAVSASSAVAIATTLQVTTLVVAFTMAGPAAFSVFRRIGF